MVIIDWFVWWYGSGLKRRFGLLGERLGRVVDFFSITLLLKTLFAPFRQISAEKSHTAPVQDRVRMFGDRLISRFIGALMRLFLIIAGVVVLAFLSIWSVLVLIFHVFRPVILVGCVVLFFVGWTPAEAWPEVFGWVKNVKF